MTQTHHGGGARAERAAQRETRACGPGRGGGCAAERRAPRKMRGHARKPGVIEMGADIIMVQGGCRVCFGSVSRLMRSINQLSSRSGVYCSSEHCSLLLLLSHPMELSKTIGHQT